MSMSRNWKLMSTLLWVFSSKEATTIYHGKMQQYDVGATIFHGKMQKYDVGATVERLGIDMDYFAWSNCHIKQRSANCLWLSYRSLESPIRVPFEIRNLESLHYILIQMSWLDGITEHFKIFANCNRWTPKQLLQIHSLISNSLYISRKWELLSPFYN